jgi:beta-lactam-binding protein with PASTA domain
MSATTTTRGLQRLAIAAAVGALAAGLSVVSVATARADVRASRTPAIRSCAVPDLVGVPLTVARARLRSAGCRLGSVSFVEHRGPHRIVFSQSVRVGHSVSTTSLVELRVAR